MRRKITPFVFALYFLVAAHIIEIVGFLLMGIGIFPTYFLLNFFIVLLLAAVIYFLKNPIVQAIVTAVFLSGQMVLMFTNYVLFSTFVEILSIETLFNASEGLRAVDASFFSGYMMALTIIMGAVNLLLIALILGNICFINGAVPKPVRQRRPKVFFAKALVAMLVLVVTVGGFNLHGALLKGNGDYLYATFNIPVVQRNSRMLFQNNSFFGVAALQNFGSFGFYFRSLWSFFLGNGGSSNQIDDALAFMEAGGRSEQSNVNLEHNFVTIMMESVDTYAIDTNPNLERNLTPNLFKLQSGTPFNVGDVQFGSYSMTNYYAKNRTNMGESGSFLGVNPYFSPFTSSWANARDDRFEGAMGFSAPYRLREELGYTTRYMIMHDMDFYGRSNVFNPGGAFGFDYSFCGATIARENNLYTRWGEWAPDTWLFEQVKEDLIPELRNEQKFYTHITTMIPHGPFGVAHGFEGTAGVRGSTAPSLAENLEQVIDAEERGWWENIMSMAINPFAGWNDAQRMREYMAAVMDLDNMIGMLFERLDDLGIADQTTVILYTDHELYYYNFSTKALQINSTVRTNPEIYRLPMFIAGPGFAQGMEFAPGAAGMPQTHEISQFTTVFDIHGTIMDLVGLPVNANTTMGQSIFVPSPNMRVFLSPTGGIFNEFIFSIDGNIDPRMVHHKVKLDDEITEEFYRAVNKTVFRADTLRHLFDNLLWTRLENKYGKV